MDSGIIVIILIFLVAFLTFGLGVFCHFCGEVGSGGRYYGSNQNIALATAIYTKRAAGAGEPTKNKCKCSRKFKGQCANCEGDTFVDDGELGSPKDFVGFGGETEFQFPGGGRGDSDAIRGIMGNGSMASAPPSALDQPDQGGNSFGGMGSSDQY